MIAFGCDHGGVELKDLLVDFLRAQGVEVRDLRHPRTDRSITRICAMKFPGACSSGEAERGVLVCTSGIGMSIVANKFPGVRAALVQDLDGARSSREHNDANILVLSGAKTDSSWRGKSSRPGSRRRLPAGGISGGSTRSARSKAILASGAQRSRSRN